MNTLSINLSDREGYELFRQAIVERDGHAWAVIYTRYRGMLLAWAYRFGNRLGLNDPADDLADQAFARAWVALTPERFGQFPTLASLLAYLRSCVSTTVIDAGRASAARSNDCSIDTIELSAEHTPERALVGEIERGEIWQIVGAVAASPQEHTVLVESFLHDQTPRAIYAGHPDLFADVGAIYRIKRTMLERLQRNHDLQQLYQAS